MLRVASAARLLRRAQGCALPLLSDAAAAHGARSAAERSSAAGLGADSALQSWRTAHRRLSAAATTPAAVVCACVLERLPIVLPPQPAWETEYQVRVLSAALASPPRVAGAWLKVRRRLVQDWRYEKLRHTFKEYPKARMRSTRTAKPRRLTPAVCGAGAHYAQGG